VVVRAPVAAVSPANTTNTPAATRYTQRVTPAPSATAVTTTTSALTPHIVTASASHSGTSTRPLSTLIVSGSL